MADTETKKVASEAIHRRTEALVSILDRSRKAKEEGNAESIAALEEEWFQTFTSPL